MRGETRDFDSSRSVRWNVAVIATVYSLSKILAHGRIRDMVNEACTVSQRTIENSEDVFYSRAIQFDISFNRFVLLFCTCVNKRIDIIKRNTPIFWNSKKKREWLFPGFVLILNVIYWKECFITLIISRNWSMIAILYPLTYFMLQLECMFAMYWKNFIFHWKLNILFKHFSNKIHIIKVKVIKTFEIKY